MQKVLHRKSFSLRIRCVSLESDICWYWLTIVRIYKLYLLTYLLTTILLLLNIGLYFLSIYVLCVSNLAVAAKSNQPLL